MGLAADRDTWRGRRVLVTGAAGFLGGVVSRHLAELGAAVVGLDVDWERTPEALRPPGVEQARGDVRDATLLANLLARDVDTVIHLAAQTLVGPALVDPVTTFSNNIEGTWTVLEACRSAKAVSSIVVASSDKAYGDWSGRPYVESMALRAHHPYDVSKAATDLLAQSYAATYGLPVTITRCGNLYGGGDVNWSRIVPGTIRSVIRGERPEIRSDGTPVRDYLHVSDGAAGVLRLAAATRADPRLRGEAFNFAASKRASVLQIVQRILRLMDSSLDPVVLANAPNELDEQRVSSARARRTLGWAPRVGLDEGLREAIEWYRTNLGLLA